MRTAFLAFLAALAVPAAAQTIDPADLPNPPVEIAPATLAKWQDRPLSWRAYSGRTHRAAATVYANAGRDAERRPWSVVLTADPGNRAPITDDALFVIDLAARDLGTDPTRLAFLFRFPLEGDARPLTVRATVRRSSSGRLVAPAWRVLSAEEVEDYTDRALR